MCVTCWYEKGPTLPRRVKKNVQLNFPSDFTKSKSSPLLLKGSQSETCDLSRLET